MKKHLLLFLVIIGCSASVKVDDVKRGKNLGKATLTTPEFMVEKFIKRSKPIIPTKTQTNYYEILFEDDTYYYWGYLSLSLKLERTVKLYKTERTQYNYVKENSYTISSWQIDSIIATNFKNNYPEFNYDSIKALNKCNFNLVKNASKKYDVAVEGVVEFYHMKKVKYKGSNDSITAPVILKTIDYKGGVKKGKYLKNMSFSYKEIKQAYLEVQELLEDASGVKVNSLKTKMAEDLSLWGDDNHDFLEMFSENTQ